MHKIRKNNVIKMEHVCEYPTFPDSDDDNLLLDDDNTSNSKRCIKCNMPSSAKQLCWSNQRYNEQFDPPEDSPLLHNDRLNSFGHLSIKDFHCHNYDNPQDNRKALKILCIVSVICFLFMIIEFVGGFLADSLAVMTDAAHLFSDVIGFFVSIISIWIGRKPPTRFMTFGYHRAEVLGAFLSVLTVWLLAGVFSVLAVQRIIRRDYSINADTMLAIAGLGLIINLTMGAILHGFCSNIHLHSHEATHNDHHTHHSDNINVRAAAAHVIGDLLQSVGVLIAAVTIKLFPNTQIADPICTILFSVIVVGATLRVAKDSVLLLVEASPCDSNVVAVGLKTIAGVKHVHSLKLWSLAPGKEAVAVHLAVDDNCDRDTILNQANYILKKKLKIVSCTIQVEGYDHEQISSCSECQQLQV